MPLDPDEICVLANPGSGGNRRDAAALDRAMAVFGPAARLRRWRPDEALADVVGEEVDRGARVVVAAGGDGTVNGVAQALMGREAALGVLPLGTFNFFARGLGLPEEPEAAARALLGGRVRKLALGTVNGQVFLNNASLGLYPLILREREQVYARFGRSRLVAYWTVLSTILRARTTRRMVIEGEGLRRDLRSPLLFVARSAYQLDRYGLPGAAAISDDKLVGFVLRAETRAGILRAVARLALRRAAVGDEIEMIEAREFTVTPAARRPHVALDGEWRELRAPLRFAMQAGALAVVLPEGRA